MDEFGKGYKWSQAAAKGLVLAAVSVLCNTLSCLFPTSAALSWLIFVVRTGVSIWLLLYFMKQYAAATGTSPFGFGVATVLLSSIICAFYDTACIVWIFPGLMTQVNDAMALYMNNLPAESQSVADKMTDNLPHIMFVSSFIKCFLEGLLASAIINPSIRSDNPFGTADSDGDDESEDELD